jgi:hypothetical protein
MPQVEHHGFSGRAADTPVAASAADVELAAVAADGWPAIETEPLGPWLLRASFGFTLRGNSVLVTGRPQEHLLEAVSSIEAWYAARDLPPIFSLPTDAQGEMTDGALAALLAHRGYQSGEWVMTMTADTEQIIASRAGAPDLGLRPRQCGSRPTCPLTGWRGSRHTGGCRPPRWPRRCSPVRCGRCSCRSPLRRCRVSGGVVSANASVLIPAAQRPLAIGRLAMTRRWGGVHAMWVAPTAPPPRPGHARAHDDGGIWLRNAAAAGLYLHVEESNTVARHLYSRFRVQRLYNGYRYLQRPPEH